MTISLEDISKRFNREWIFRNINLTLQHNTSVAITGPNGSGKSTLLQIISGNLLPSKGKVIYTENGKVIDEDKMYQYLTYCAPYLDIIEEFTLEEFLAFHFKFKNINDNIEIKELPEKLQLQHAKSKKIKDYSTGMRQRVKLGICFYGDTPLILLDEPTTNLDHNGIDWYLKHIEMIKKERTIMVSSNSEVEFSFCQEKIEISDFK